MTGISEHQAAVEGLLLEKSDRDYIVISHSIDRSLHLKLSRLLAEKQKNKSCTVFLTTWGGDPNGGYRTARCLRHHYSDVRLAIPSFCKSAGTLIAIAASELAIGDLGELGPLDIQVRKGSELQENSSGLDIMQALQAVTSHTQDAFYRLMVGTRGFGLSTKLCAEFAATVASGIAAPLISQIDPIRLGEMQRATRVAFEYGERLNSHSKNLKPGALQRLIGEYPAHGFVIDRKEAVELFEKVSHLSEAEKKFSEVFWSIVEKQSDVDPILIELPTTKEAEAHDGNPDGEDLQGNRANRSNPKEDHDRDGEGEHHHAGNSANTNGQGISVRTSNGRQRKRASAA